jgi:hypothetical protein
MGGHRSPLSFGTGRYFTRPVLTVVEGAARFRRLAGAAPLAHPAGPESHLIRSNYGQVLMSIDQKKLISLSVILIAAYLAFGFVVARDWLQGSNMTTSSGEH